MVRKPPFLFSAISAPTGDSMSEIGGGDKGGGRSNRGIGSRIEAEECLSVAAPTIPR